MSTVDSVAVVGVGLIGGSLAGALRKAGFARRVLGMDTDAAAAQTALQRGLVDEVVEEMPAQVDLIAVCTSSDQIARQVASLASHARVIMDVGSVKAPIVEALRREFGGVPENFVPCHPIAGSERSGPTAASEDLFAEAVVVVTSEVQADPQHAALVQLAEAAWQAAGATVLRLSPEAHDEMLAVTSHLPHLLAFAYMQQIDAALLPYTGGGFRDFTRIAAANPELWWRILSMNKEAVLSASEQFVRDLEALIEALRTDQKEDGVQALRRAVALRRGL